MGASCCCLRFVDLDDYADPNGDIYRHCICFRCFAQRFVSMLLGGVCLYVTPLVPSCPSGGISLDGVANSLCILVVLAPLAQRNT
ncbi:hypothetical protein ACLOJK_035664 [Asimina triloba]